MKKILAVIALVAMVVLPANFAFAGGGGGHDDRGDGGGTNVEVGIDFRSRNNNENFNDNYNRNNNENYNQNRQRQNQEQEQKQKQTLNNENDLSNQNNVYVGGQSTNINIEDKREFVPPISGYQTQLSGGPNTTNHHRTAQSSVIEPGCYTQKGFDSMIGFLEKAHELDSNTRTWPDMRSDLVIQPRFEYPRSPLADGEPVKIITLAGNEKFDTRPEEVVGYITVRDKKPTENSVDSMYFLSALYPYAKLGGANTLIKADHYFWSKVKAGSWGAGVGGVLSRILDALTGGTVSANGGISSANSMEYVAGGEMYLALRLSQNLCLPVPVAVVKQPEPAPAPKPEPKCDPDPIRKEIAKIEREIRDCKFWSMHNLVLRGQGAYLYEQLYNCTGKTDKSLLEKSLFHARKAQQNYDEVTFHPKSRAVSRDNWDEKRAISVLKVTYWNEAAAVREISGREAEIRYAREKGLERMPSSTDEIQEVTK
jgi:hypothetical protein